MSERVELEVVGGYAVGGFDEVTKHSYGLYKGARRYKPKLRAKMGVAAARVELAGSLIAALQEEAREYAREKGIDYNPGMAGVAAEYIRYRINGMKTAAEKIKELVDADWKEFLDRAYEKHGEKYKSIISVR